jgi:Amt family ammonium transporter
VLDCFVQPLHDEGQDVELVVVEMRDITELRSTARQLAAERDQAAATLDALTNALVRVDRAGRIAYVNPAAAALLDRGAEELCGQPAERVIDLDCMSEHPVTRVLRTGAGVQSAQGVPLRRHDGSGAIVEYAAFPVLGPSSGATVPQCILVLNDVTQAHELTERIAYQARHDSLTGLFNRREFERRLKRCFEQARHEGAKHTLVYIDLDQFKLVNDTCGHVVGDRLLRQVSRWIRAALRENQILARIGGDEFGLLVLHSDLESGARTAERILAALQEYRFRWNRRVFQVGASMGVVPVEASAGTVEHVLAAADSACFAAKELGRNRIKVFRPDDDLLARREREMHCVPRVTEAIRNDGLCLYCQPIARADGQPGQRFHEILVRMTEPDGRVVSPDQFLPAAERFGLITDLDAWVVGEVIAHIEQVEGTVSVNLSGHSLARPSFMADVHRLVRDGVADPRQLVFEITETAVMADMDASLRAMEKLRELGCGFALDDFGTGLSSFGYLKQLPVDYVKIDGLFVQDLVTEAFDRSIVGAIAQMTRILGKRSIAEKVEDPDMIPTLHAMGVDFVQGYACGMPQPWSAVRNGSKDPETLSAAPRGRAF